MIYHRAKATAQKDQDVLKKIATELRKRKNKILAAQNGIMDYIKDIAFPAIEIEYKNS